VKKIIDDTSFIEISPSHSIPHASHDYWEDKVAEARAKMKEMGVQHLLEKKIEKQPPKLRRRVS
jgi:hypothetical protein